MLHLGNPALGQDPVKGLLVQGHVLFDNSFGFLLLFNNVLAQVVLGLEEAAQVLANVGHDRVGLLANSLVLAVHGATLFDEAHGRGRGSYQSDRIDAALLEQEENFRVKKTPPGFKLAGFRV
jgi:hypothetical protein